MYAESLLMSQDINKLSAKGPIKNYYIILLLLLAYTPEKCANNYLMKARREDSRENMLRQTALAASNLLLLPGGLQNSRSPSQETPSQAPRQAPS